jgi:glycosyltransferase involved in cell wall biosynthesis
MVPVKQTDQTKAECPEGRKGRGGAVISPPQARTLYLCYFGLREPLVQTQVLPYLRQLIAAGIEVRLVTFEPELRRRWTNQELSSDRARLADDGICWFYLPYHKWPSLPATLYDILAGARLASRLVRTQGVGIIHARSHVPAAMGAIAKWASGGYLIFDIRGFMPEEYTDGGVWPEGGYLYRLTKAVERRLFASSDGFVVLTERARQILFGANSGSDLRGRPVEVIPCCIDPERFRQADEASRERLRRELKVEDRRVVIYVGALGGWYLTDEMADFMATAHRQDAATYSVILSQSDPELITDRLHRRGVAEGDFLVRQVAPADVPRYIRAADIALSFIKSCYSKQSSSPTKIAEYLAGGLPIICNAGIGDVDEVIESDGVGFVIREFSEAAYLEALEAVEALRREGDLAERCRTSARRRFDLERVGGARYRRLYQRLSEREAKHCGNGERENDGKKS